MWKHPNSGEFSYDAGKPTDCADSAPFRTAEFDLTFDGGISREGDLLDLGVECEIVQKSGAWLNYGEVRLGQGREKAKKYLIENKELCEEIKDKVLVAKGMKEES